MYEEDRFDQESDELFEHHRLQVDAGQQALRIDKFLFERISNVTRSKVQGAIKMGFVLVNNQPVKPNYKVASERYHSNISA